MQKAWLIALALCTPALNAQQRYYQLQQNYEAGEGKRVIETTHTVIPGGMPEYVVVGDCFTFDRLYTATFAGRYDRNGDTLWHKLIRIPGLVVTGTTDGIDICENGSTGDLAMIGYANNMDLFMTTFTQQSVIIILKKDGSYLTHRALGSERVAAILYDKITNAYIVAGETRCCGNSTDIQVMSLDAGTLAVNWCEYFPSSTSNETTVDMICDSNGDYLVAATTQRFSGDKDIVVVKVDNAGTSLWAAQYGTLPVGEMAVGIAEGEDPSVPGIIYGVLCYYTSGTIDVPFMFTIDKTGGTVVRYKEYNAATESFTPKALEYNPRSQKYIIAGRETDPAAPAWGVNAFAMVTERDLDFNNCLYYQNALTQDGYESFNDVTRIQRDAGIFGSSTDFLMFTGGHENYTTWNNSIYPMIQFADPLAVGGCNDVVSLTDRDYPVRQGFIALSLPTTIFGSVDVRVDHTPGFYLDPCIVSRNTAIQPDEPATAVMYPNPASTSLTINHTLSGTDMGYFALYDALGQEVFKTQVTGTGQTIDLQKTMPGIYIARLIVNNTLVNEQKLIINR